MIDDPELDLMIGVKQQVYLTRVEEPTWSLGQVGSYVRRLFADAIDVSEAAGEIEPHEAESLLALGARAIESEIEYLGREGERCG